MDRSWISIINLHACMKLLVYHRLVQVVALEFLKCLHEFQVILIGLKISFGSVEMETLSYHGYRHQSQRSKHRLQIVHLSKVISKSKHLNRDFKRIFLEFLECNEYHNALYETRLVLRDSEKTEETYLKCPIAVSSYILEGEDAYGKEFPHMVSLHFGFECDIIEIISLGANWLR